MSEIIHSAKPGSIKTLIKVSPGKKVAVPDHLDWELWQGPAPREDYRDNIVSIQRAGKQINESGNTYFSMGRWILYNRFVLKYQQKRNVFSPKDNV